jgi:hypothetical protein
LTPQNFHSVSVLKISRCTAVQLVKKIFPLKSIEELRADLNSHKLFLRLRFPIQCNQKPCRASTGGIKEYVNKLMNTSWTASLLITALQQVVLWR